MKFSIVSPLWRENKGFTIKRNTFSDEYIFIHYLTPVKIYENNELKNIESGACILYNKGSYQYFISDECELIHDWFHLKGDLSAIISKTGFILDKIYTPKNHNFITQYLQKIEIECLKKNKFYEEITTLMLEEMLYKIMRNSSCENEEIYVTKETKQIFLNLRNYLLLNYNKEIMIKDMAQFVNLSQSHFFEMYKNIFGISPKKDLINQRIEHAKIMLLQNNTPICQIAQDVGYNNEFHFIRQFKIHTTKTPSKWREENL